jgi:hypothetical protein
MPSKLEYRQPSTPGNVQQADHGDITQLNAVLPQFPAFVELVRIRLRLLERKEKHKQTRENLGKRANLTYKVQTVDASRDTLNKAGHRDRHVFPKLPIIDPELVVEEFVPRPLQRARDKKNHSGWLPISQTQLALKKKNKKGSARTLILRRKLRLHRLSMGGTSAFAFCSE